MLGYTESDLNRMITAVHDSKLFYLRTPSDLMDKEPLRKDLETYYSEDDGGYLQTMASIETAQHLLSVAEGIMAK